MSSRALRTVVLAGGGTGGHVFPALALAEAMVKLVPDVRPLFVGTARGMEGRLVPERGFELEVLDVLPMRGGGPAGFARGAWRAAALLPRSRRLLKERGVLGVLSVGGYAADPVSLAARTLGLPVGLLEPNSVMGLSNQLLAPFVQRAYTAFPLAERHFAPAVLRPLGVPIRSGFVAQPYPAGAGVRVLVLGGSQGASALNEILPQVLTALHLMHPALRVVHQCGGANQDAVTASYQALGGNFARVVPFIDDMPQALAEAELVIGRSGAGAVSEITAVGRPSLLIPYPYASGDHQRLNAEALVARGAAVCIAGAEASPARLEQEIGALLSARSTLSAMAAAARDFGRPDASGAIARDFLGLLGLVSNEEIG